MDNRRKSILNYFILGIISYYDYIAMAEANNLCHCFYVVILQNFRNSF